MRYLILIALLSSCKPAAPDVAVDVSFDELKKRVTDPTRCFEQNPDYCLDVAAQAIEKAQKLGTYKKGIPKTSRALKRFIGTAQMRYGSLQLDTPEKRAQVLEKVKATFENPKMFKKVDTVYVDAGLVPTEWAKARAGYRLQTSNDILFDKFELKGSVIAKKLLAGLKKFPEAKTVSLRYFVYDQAVPTTLTWHIAKERIAYNYGGNTQWLSQADIGKRLERLLSGEAKLFDAALSCTTSDNGTREGCLFPHYFPKK